MDLPRARIISSLRNQTSYIIFHFFPLKAQTLAQVGSEQCRSVGSCGIGFLVRVTAKVTVLGWSYLQYSCFPGRKATRMQAVTPQAL